MIPASNDDASSQQVTISIGDTVRVLTKYGDRPTFKVSDISETALTGENQVIFYDDIAFVEKRVREITNTSTLSVILVIVSGTVLVKTISDSAVFPDVQ
jgi:hypothetical protein